MMKQRNLLFMLTFLSVVITSKYLYGQDNEISIYGGMHYAGLKTIDFENFEISDWENYGLKSQDPLNEEGRVRIPLGNYKLSGKEWGLFLGLNFPLTERSKVLAEFQCFLQKDIDVLGFSLGNNFNLIKPGGFNLDFTLKAGYFYANIDFAKINPLWDYSCTISTSKGSFTDRDSISIDIHGFNMQIGITPCLHLTEQIGIQAQVGYGLSLAFKSEITIQPIKNDNKIKLDMRDRAIVRCDGSNTEAGLEPSVKSEGVYFRIGVFYYIDI